MNRRPPAKVRRTLRHEVGFGCPVPDCGKPYLEWHHFDPPWNIENHHKPEGMVALCREHHIQADNGAFTNTQLHEFKANGRENWKKIQGKFSWLRYKLLVVVGGNFYYETPIILQSFGCPVIWLERDENNYLMLNFYMLSNSGQPRAYMRNNEWFNAGGEADIECSPSAKYLKVKYPNGDVATVEFINLDSLDAANKRYSETPVDDWGIEYPITAVEVTMIAANSNIRFGPKETTIGGINLKNNFSAFCGAGLTVG